MATLQLEVVTPERTVLTTEAESIIVPAVDGAMGFMRHHTPLVAGLTVGVVRFGPQHREKENVAITGGFVEVNDNRVTVLADVAEVADEIDLERAKAARERAEERLRMPSPDVDHTRAEIALRRAINRLRVASSRG